MSTQQHIEVGYALSNRIRCQQCQQNIPKNELKIGIVMVRRPEARFDRKIWYHLGCIRQVPKGDHNKDLDIVNFHGLKPDDQKKIQARLKELKPVITNKKMIKEEKFSTKSEGFCTYFKAPQMQCNTWVSYVKAKERKDLYHEY